MDRKQERKQRNDRIMELWPALQAKATYLATRYGCPQSQAPDIANELALACLERAEAVPGFLIDNNQTYITLYAACRWQDRRRHEALDTRGGELDAPVSEEFTLADLLPDPAPGAVETLVGTERRDALRAAIDALPEALRDVVTLAYGAGQTHAEIGQRLGRPAGTVSYQLSKARGLLATSLAGF